MGVAASLACLGSRFILTLLFEVDDKGAFSLIKVWSVQLCFRGNERVHQGLLLMWSVKPKNAWRSKSERVDMSRWVVDRHVQKADCMKSCNQPISFASRESTPVVS